MTNAVLMERLCELVLQPRQHLLTQHGALESASGLRPKVVPPHCWRCCVGALVAPVIFAFDLC